MKNLTPKQLCANLLENEINNLGLAMQKNNKNKALREEFSKLAWELIGVYNKLYMNKEDRIRNIHELFEIAKSHGWKHPHEK